MCVCAHMSVYMYVHIGIYVRMSAWYVYVCVCMCPPAYVCGVSMCVHICVYACVCANVCTCVCCVSVCACTCASSMYVCMYMCILFTKGKEKSSLSQVGKTPPLSPTLCSIRAAAGKRVPGDSYLDSVNFKNSRY